MFGNHPESPSRAQRRSAGAVVPAGDAAGSP